jgi:hypothetical protein
MERLPGTIEPQEDVVVVSPKEIRLSTEESWRMVRAILESDGYHISVADETPSYATLYWPRVLRCGSCHKDIDRQGAALHKHMCEHCGAFTSVWYPKESAFQNYYGIAVFQGIEYKDEEPLPFPEYIVIHKQWLRKGY